MKESPATQYLRKLLAQFPKAATKTIARTAYAASPEYWSDLEACRDNVRRIRGEQGAIKRANATDKSQFNPTKITGMEALPEPWKEMPFEAYDISGPATVLVMSDIHLPYYDKTALLTAIRYAKKQGVTHVLLNGDVHDFFAVSSWQTDPRQRDFAGEIKLGREFYAQLRKEFPKQPIDFKPGNHDERLERYLMLKAPELLGIDDIELSNILRFSDHGINKINEMVPVRIGKLNALHGHEYRFAISNPVNPARGLFLRAKVHALCGHFHQTSQHSEKNLEENVVSCWSTACLCNMHPQYRPINNWNHGFAIVRTDKQGVFEVDNKRIIHGKVY